MLSNQKRHSVRKTPTKKKDRDRFFISFTLSVILDLDIKNNITADHRFTSNFPLLKEVFLAKKNMNEEMPDTKLVAANWLVECWCYDESLIL